MSDRRTLLAGIVLIALVVRLAGIGDGLSEDEGFSWLVASAPDVDTFLDRLAAYENTPPLFYALLAPLPLEEEHWLRLPSLVAGIACVPVLYLAVRPLLGTGAALLSALGLAVAPYAVNWSNFSRGFMLANLGLLVALWAVVRLGGGNRGWWWVYVAGAVLALYSEYDASLFLAALIVSFAWMSPGRRLEILVLGALPALALLPWLGELLRSLDALDETKAAPMYPHPSLRSLRDSTVPLFAGEHGTADSAGLRTAQFALVVAALTAAVALLRARGKHDALRLLGLTALGTLALHALATLLGPDIFAQRYLTSLLPLAVAVLAGGVVLVPSRWFTIAAAVCLLGLGVAVFVQRHGRELEPDIDPVAALIERSGDRLVLTNSARVAFYLRDLYPHLDRPLGFGIDAEAACGPPCPFALAIVDDARAPAGVRTGPGQTHVFGPLHVRLREPTRPSRPVGFNNGVDPLTCSLAMLVSAALGGGETRALPVTVQDDALMLHKPPAEVHETANRLARLGADRIRVTAGWSSLAPKPRARRMPRFDATRSDDYPREPWIRLDRAVKAAVGAGLEPQLDIAFFAPRWAARRREQPSRRGRYRWDPHPGLFAQFAEAVARRYNGTHRDPTRPEQQLPAVRLWTTWNEPNHPSFFLPQWRRVDGSWVPRSPHLYRELHEQGYEAINRVNEQNRVLIGATAPRGHRGRGPRKAIAPLHFLRELACVDRAGEPLERPECSDFEPLEADGYSHHPYTFYGRPDAPSANPDDVVMGDLERLTALLERLHELGRTTSELPVLVTEYGYETNPPDRFRGVSLMQQARYHGLATFTAWRQDHVTSFAQFLVNDIAPPDGAGPVERASNFQTGLYFHDGRPKPAAQAFKLPFWAEPRSVTGGDFVVIFGQVRPATGNRRIEIEVKGPNDTWVPIHTYETRRTSGITCGEDETIFLTDSEGFYLRVAPYQGRATYRARWIRDDGKSEYSIPVRIDDPPPAPTGS